MFIDSDSNGGSFGTFDTDQDDVYSNHTGIFRSPSHNVIMVQEIVVQNYKIV